MTALTRTTPLADALLDQEQDDGMTDEPVGELHPTDEPGVRVDDLGQRWYSAAWL